MQDNLQSIKYFDGNSSIVSDSGNCVGMYINLKMPNCLR